MQNFKTDFIYSAIAGNIEKKIVSGVLKMGDKLPSVRVISRENGASISTILQAYYVLESKGLIEARPQSGYYVTHCSRLLPNMVATSKPNNNTRENDIDSIIAKIYAEMGNTGNQVFSLGVPASELLPLAKLNKAIIQSVRELDDSGTAYEPVAGNMRLRRQIARHAYTWDSNLVEDDIVTTAGCMNALANCMISLASKGDTIAVESPVYFGIIQLARSLGLNIIELPTNAQTGIEIEALEKELKNNRIKLCLLVSNFSNPIGSCMPDEHKKKVVQLMEHYNVPLIEDDLYGDVYFGSHRPKSCKTFDESGIVLWCGSFSKTLAPGYRVGWVAPGKFKEQIIKTKLFHNISSTTLTQEAIGSFLENGRYENHLRKLRNTLHMNSLNFLRTISEHFPEGTKVTRPQGGFILWLELHPKIDTMDLYELALKHRISIAPGRMFTSKQQYNNCLRLSYGLNWNEDLRQGLVTLGTLAKTLLNG
ncbi:MAG TPA: PLP-dependent aminotransferase family protein [Flavobacterium sp.]|nr:PLP-dependent aminotransferase family protein [Flavobacterium sp.]